MSVIVQVSIGNAALMDVQVEEKQGGLLQYGLRQTPQQATMTMSEDALGDGTMIITLTIARRQPDGAPLTFTTGAPKPRNP